MSLVATASEITIVNAHSMSATFQSNGWSIQSIDNVGAQFIWTATAAVGTWGFDVSNTSTDGIDGTWTALTLPTIAEQPAGTSSTVNFAINFRQLPYKWIRVTYTAVSGTGTASVYMFGKKV